MTGRSLTNVHVQRALGAFVGAAVGDALGAPFEFLPGGRYRSTFPAPVLAGIGEMTGGGPWDPGEFTDDTQMAVALAESLLAHGRLDERDVWARWRAWAGDAKDVGVLTGYALAATAPDGAAASAHASNSGRSAGNGTIMRNTPIALFTLGQSVDDAVAMSRRQAALTHHDPSTHIGAALHTVMLRAAIMGDDPLAALDACIAELPAEPRSVWSALLGPVWAPEHSTTKNGTVWTCLAQAVWCLRRASTFEEAVVSAVNLGDDADTVACVTGALAGARFGIQAIPSRWTTYLNGRVSTPEGVVHYDNAALQDLARRLVGLAAVPMSGFERTASPNRVHDEVPVYAANWPGAVEAPTDWAIVSLCRTGDTFANHAVRRQVFLIDRYDETDNHDLAAAVRDAVDTIDALLIEVPDRPVVVHCHAGRSRTALVLKCWAMRRHGWSEQAAHDWLNQRWPLADRSNPVFVDFMRSGLPW